jgi:hypothetical protein
MISEAVYTEFHSISGSASLPLITAFHTILEVESPGTQEVSIESYSMVANVIRPVFLICRSWPQQVSDYCAAACS